MMVYFEKFLRQGEISKFKLFGLNKMVGECHDEKR